MDWQLAVVGVLIAGAGAYLARSTWRTWSGRGKAGCGGGCACPANPASDQPDRQQIIPAEQIRLVDRH